MTSAMKRGFGLHDTLTFAFSGLTGKMENDLWALKSWLSSWPANAFQCHWCPCHVNSHGAPLKWLLLMCGFWWVELALEKSAAGQMLAPYCGLKNQCKG